VKFRISKEDKEAGKKRQRRIKVGEKEKKA
jgi:hypothetical protein